MFLEVFIHVSLISIHALLAESDSSGIKKTLQSFNFYPRSPCGERLSIERCSFEEFRFLSTLSLRRATPHFYQQTAYFFYFYPRSPCGERPSMYMYGILYL